MTMCFLMLALLFRPAALIVISPDFPDGGSIPARFTCDGENVHPNLIINGIPEGTKSMALIVEDQSEADVVTTRWMVWNIAPTEMIFEGSNAGAGTGETACAVNYEGPCPSSGFQRYVFRVFALDTTLDLSTKVSRLAVDEAMEGHVLASGTLSGEYSRSVTSSKNTNRKKRR